jgi:hypothetical protein
VNDVRANVIKELGIVRYDQASASLEILNVLSEPLDGKLIQVIGGLIEKKPASGKL